MQIKLYPQIKPINKSFFHIEHKNDTINPKFKNCELSKELSEALRVQKLAFLGKTNEVKEITPEILHKKFVEQANNYTLSDIKGVYNNILQGLQEKGVEVKPDEIKYTMGLLTQFGGIEGIVKLAEKTHKKIDTDFFRGDTPNLSQFMSYMQRTRYFLPKATYNAWDNLYLFADKKSLEYLSEEDEEILDRTNPKVIYPTGWDRGITFLDPQIGFKKFEENAIDVISSTKKKYPNEEFPIALNKFLDEEAADFTESKGYQINDFISITPLDKKIEFDDILNNINLQIPSTEKIQTVVDSISEVFEEKSESYSGQKDVIKGALLKYFYNTFNIISPRSMTEGMRELYKKIEESLPNGKTMDDAVIIMPDSSKSTVYIVRQFASINNIDPKQIHTGTKCVNLAKIQDGRDTGFYSSGRKEPYRDEIIVLIDDNSLSGTAILGQGDKGFGYDYYPIEWELNNTYIFGRVYAAGEAIEILNRTINRKKRDENPNCQDKFIYARKIKSDTEIPYTKEEKEIINQALNIFRNRFGKEGFGGVKANVIFPFTAPDNNSGLANFLALQFYPRKYCVKVLSWDKEIYNEISQKIEEKSQKLST